MKKSSYVLKIVILLIVFVIINVFTVYFGNIIVHNKKFDVNEGEYAYSDIFYSPTPEKDYYRFSKNYYDDSKYISGDDVFKNLTFKVVDKYKAIAILSLVSKSSFLGWCTLTDIEMTDQELVDAYNKTDYIYYANVYNVFGKTYLYGHIKDFVYTIDAEYSREDNFYLATKTNNSQSVILLEADGLDLSLVKQGEKTTVTYYKPFVDIFSKPYSYILMVLYSIEMLTILYTLKGKRKSK